RERMPLQQVVRDTQLGPHSSNLVFEKEPQRLYQLEVHRRRQPADIVMGFDRYGWAMYTHALDDIGIDRTLSQQFYAGDFFCFLLEYFDKKPADGFPFCLGVRLARELAIKKTFGIDTFDIQSDAFIGLQHLRKLVLAQYAVVYKNAVQPVADGLVDQRRRY